MYTPLRLLRGCSFCPRAVVTLAAEPASTGIGAPRSREALPRGWVPAREISGWNTCVLSRASRLAAR